MDVSYLMELGVFGAGSRIDSEQIMQFNGLLSSRFQFHAGSWNDTRFSVIPFSTLDQGPGYALELMNTGARSSNTVIAGIIGYSAAQPLGIANLVPQVWH